MLYSKDNLKEKLTLDDIYFLLEFLDAEPEDCGDYITALTVCHGGDSKKMYYYENSHLFHCYSGGCGSFDVFELVQKVRQIENLSAAILFVVNFFNLQGDTSLAEDAYFSEDWKIFNKHEKTSSIDTNKAKIALKEYPPNTLQHFPRPHIKPWEEQFIKKDVCDYMGICYNPVEGGILIPHKDENGRLIGIRQRTLVKDQEQYGKYRPWRKEKQVYYNHPLGFNLYGLYEAKENIKTGGLAIVVESEKAVLAYMSYFGIENNICVAVCGDSLSRYQFDLLLEAGVKEVVIAFDKDYCEPLDDDYADVLAKLEKLYGKYQPYAAISFLLDMQGLLEYKDSPLDKGKEVFLKLWEGRYI